MSKLKLMIVMGTRPEIIKLSEIIKKCDKYFDLKIVHTGQNYDYNLNKVFFEDLGLREPDFYLGVVGDNLGQTMGNVLAKSYELTNTQIQAIVEPDGTLDVIEARILALDGHFHGFYWDIDTRAGDLGDVSVEVYEAGEVDSNGDLVPYEFASTGSAEGTWLPISARWN